MRGEFSLAKKITERFSRKQIYSIALAYSRGDYSYHHFVREYPNCTQHQFYNVLHLSVDRAIVPEEIARKIQRVAVASSLQKARESFSNEAYINGIGTRVYRSWEKRIANSRNFRFSKLDSKRIAQQYSDSRFSKKDFCEINHINGHLFDITLINAIIYSWISDDCFDKLFDKAIKFANGSETVSRVYHLFEQLTQRRIENKNAKKQK